MKLEIRGMLETSLLDWDGKVVTTLFAPRCNFRCPFCQNAGLVLHPRKYQIIPFSKIFEHLSKYTNWIDGICLTGGEPCLYEDIDEFLKEVKQLKFKVKLDTNGSFPNVIEKLIQKQLVDYVAMDIKAPIETKCSGRVYATDSDTIHRNCSGRVYSAKNKTVTTKYDEAAGVKINIEKIKKSIKIIMTSGINYEFRTTVVPTLHTSEDILEIAKSIKGAEKYYLQNFSNKEVMNPDFKKIIPYKKEELDEMKKLILPFVKNIGVRF